MNELKVLKIKKKNIKKNIKQKKKKTKKKKRTFPPTMLMPRLWVGSRVMGTLRSGPQCRDKTDEPLIAPPGLPTPTNRPPTDTALFPDTCHNSMQFNNNHLYHIIIHYYMSNSIN